MSSKENSGFLDKITPVLLLASIIMAFIVGVLWQKVNSLEKGTSTSKNLGQNVGSKDNGTDNSADFPDPVQGKMTEEQVKKIASVDDEDHIRGDKNAKVFLIEYSDYECPFCSRFHPTAQKIFDEYKGQVAWVYRHFPLDAIHPKARPAANAAECIAKLSGEEAFWKFSNEVFANQTENLADLNKAAEKIGAGGEEFKSCLDSKKYNNLVDKDLNEGTQAGVKGTPGNIIINQKGEAWFVPGAYPYEQMKNYIDEALKG